MSHFLLIVNDTDKEIDRRFEEKTWPLYKRTPHVNELKPGDGILIYRGGSKMHCFIGSGKIKSVVASGSKHIQLATMKRWKKPVLISEVINDLSLIKNPSHYGVYLVGGIRRLSADDFTCVTSKVGA